MPGYTAGAIARRREKTTGRMTSLALFRAPLPGAYAYRYPHQIRLAPGSFTKLENLIFNS
jgi:hypothetical protein